MKSKQDVTKCIIQITDAKYEKTDLRQVVEDNCTHLGSLERTALLELLKEFKEFFDGTLGNWDTEPINFQLKEGVKPYHNKAFPIPKIQQTPQKRGGMLM